MAANFPVGREPVASLEDSHCPRCQRHEEFLPAFTTQLSVACKPVLQGLFRHDRYRRTSRDKRIKTVIDNGHRLQILACLQRINGMGCTTIASPLPGTDPERHTIGGARKQAGLHAEQRSARLTWYRVAQIVFPQEAQGKNRVGQSRQPARTPLLPNRAGNTADSENVPAMLVKPLQLSGYRGQRTT